MEKPLLHRLPGVGPRLEAREAKRVKKLEAKLRAAFRGVFEVASKDPRAKAPREVQQELDRVVGTLTHLTKQSSAPAKRPSALQRSDDGAEPRGRGGSRSKASSKRKSKGSSLQHSLLPSGTDRKKRVSRPLPGGADAHLVIVGGQGVAWLVQLPGGWFGALKTIITGTEKGDLETFLREVEAVRGFPHHPHVARLLFATPHEGQMFIASEWIEGKTLRQKIEERKQDAQKFDRSELLGMEAEELTNVALGLCRGLAFCHMEQKDRRGKVVKPSVVHGDIKPDNVILREERLLADGTKMKLDIPEPVILDMGLARRGHESAHRGGTPGYMAPHETGVDEALPGDDVYSLGITLFEAMTGRLPFKPDAEGRTSHRALGDEDFPESLRKHPVKEVVQKALAPKAEGRYKSGGEMLADLEGRLKRQSSKWWGKIPALRKVTRQEADAQERLREAFRSWLPNAVDFMGDPKQVIENGMEQLQELSARELFRPGWMKLLKFYSNYARMHREKLTDADLVKLFDFRRLRRPLEVTERRMDVLAEPISTGERSEPLDEWINYPPDLDGVILSGLKLDDGFRGMSMQGAELLNVHAVKVNRPLKLDLRGARIEFALECEGLNRADLTRKLRRICPALWGSKYDEHTRIGIRVASSSVTYWIDPNVSDLLGLLQSDPLTAPLSHIMIGPHADLHTRTIRASRQQEEGGAEPWDYSIRALSEMCSDVSGLDLRGADLRGLDLTGVKGWPSTSSGSGEETALVKGMMVDPRCLTEDILKLLRGRKVIGIDRDLRGVTIIRQSLDFPSTDDSEIVDLTGARLVGCSFLRKRLRCVLFEGAELRNCSFEDADLRGLDLRSAALTNNCFKGALFDDKALLGNLDPVREQMIGPGGRIQSIGQSASKTMKQRLEGADLRGMVFEGCDLKAFSFRRARLEGAKFINCNLPDGIAAWDGAVMDGMTVAHEGGARGGIQTRLTAHLIEAGARIIAPGVRLEGKRKVVVTRAMAHYHKEQVDAQGRWEKFIEEFIGLSTPEQRTRLAPALQSLFADDNSLRNLLREVFKSGTGEEINALVFQIKSDAAHVQFAPEMIQLERRKVEKIVPFDFGELDMEDVDLRRAVLVGCDLRKVTNLYKAKLTGMVALECEWPAGITDEQLTSLGVIGVNGDFRNADLRGCDMSRLGIPPRGEVIHAASAAGSEVLMARRSLDNIPGPEELLSSIEGSVYDGKTLLQGGARVVSVMSRSAEPFLLFGPYANLRGLDCGERDLRGVDMVHADLRGADLSRVLMNEKTNLEGTLYDAETRFPEGFDPAGRGMVLEGEVPDALTDDADVGQQGSESEIRTSGLPEPTLAEPKADEVQGTTLNQHETTLNRPVEGSEHEVKVDVTAPVETKEESVRRQVAKRNKERRKKMREERRDARERRKKEREGGEKRKFDRRELE